jgi:ribosome maturation factor RimP
MIPQQEIVDSVTRVVKPVLEEVSLELVEVEFRPSGRRWLLRIFIDKPGGVSIADCEWVSRELDRLLDVEDVIDHPYVLEVSSPGLTRSLKSREDFERYEGRVCRIVTREAVEGKNEFRGTIAGVDGENVEIRGEKAGSRIPLSAIKKANLELEI